VVHVFLARDSDSNDRERGTCELLCVYGLQQQVDSEEWRNQTRASLRPRFEKQLYGGDVVASYCGFQMSEM
jgi:hypothetical protein